MERIAIAGIVKKPDQASIGLQSIPSESALSRTSESATSSPSQHRAGRFAVDPPKPDRADLDAYPRRSRKRKINLSQAAQHNAVVAVRRMRLVS